MPAVVEAAVGLAGALLAGTALARVLLLRGLRWTWPALATLPGALAALEWGFDESGWLLALPIFTARAAWTMAGEDTGGVGPIEWWESRRGRRAPAPEARADAGPVLVRRSSESPEERP